MHLFFIEQKSRKTLQKAHKKANIELFRSRNIPATGWNFFKSNNVTSDMQNQFSAAINQICSEKRLEPEVVISGIEQGVVAAFRRDHGIPGAEYEAKMDDTGQFNISRVYNVVDEIIDPDEIIAEREEHQAERERELEAKIEEAKKDSETPEELEKELLEAAQQEWNELDSLEPPMTLEAQMLLEDAQRVNANAVVGGTVREDVTPVSYGRIAAQTAKQVIMQRIREAERESIYNAYKDKEGEILNAQVSRVEPNGDAYLDIDRNQVLLHRRNMIPGERLRNGQRIRVLVSRVERTNRGPEIVISRTEPELVMRLLEMEVPEIIEGSVEVAAISREAGIRTKIAVRALEKGVDPVGSCVGQKGIRIQNITDELNQERIDIIQAEEDMVKYLMSALSPANIISIELEEETKTAKVYVTVDQRSLAIGKNGQNVRLASKLLGWEIDILDWVAGEVKEESVEQEEESAEEEVDEQEVEEVQEESEQEVEDATEEPEVEEIKDEEEEEK